MHCGHGQHRLHGKREGGWHFGRGCNYKDFTSCCTVVKVSIDGKVRGGEGGRVGRGYNFTDVEFAVGKVQHALLSPRLSRLAGVPHFSVRRQARGRIC